MEVALGSYRLIIQLPAESIGMLLFLIGLTTVSYYFMRKFRGERTLKLGNFQTLKDVHGKRSIASPSVLIVKIATIVMLFLVATGSIQILSEEPVSDTDFVVGIDASQSMLTPDYPPSRLDFAKTTTNKWVSRLPSNTEISVLKFSGEVTPIKTPTNERSSVSNSIKQIEADLDSSGTAMGEAINIGTNILSESQNKRKIVLVTDGMNTAGMNVSKALGKARNENVTVDIIGITSTEKTDALFQNLTSTLRDAGVEQELERPEINSQQLKNYATSTGGKYYGINNQTFMDESLQNIVLKDETVELNSNYYVLIFISLLIISEMLLYSKFGAI